jgi:pentatricopeptide repeat protein
VGSRYFTTSSHGQQQAVKLPARSREANSSHSSNKRNEKTSNQSSGRVPFRDMLFRENKEDATRLLQMKTKSLLESPLGLWSRVQWQVWHQILQIWITRGKRKGKNKEYSFHGSPESVLGSFSLLERGLVELKRSTSLEYQNLAKKALNTELLNDIINSWVDCWKKLHSSQKETNVSFDALEQQAKILLEFPIENVLSRIEAYKVRSAGLLMPDKGTFIMLLSAASASHNNKKPTPFALKLLDRMLKEASEQESLFSPNATGFRKVELDQEMYMKFVKACARVGDAAQAEACLEHMYKEYEKSGREQLKPNTKIFNAVLLAWSQSTGDLKYASERSQGILRRMRALSEKGGVLEGDAKPDFLSCSLTLKCMSRWIADSVADDDLFKVKEFAFVGEDADAILQEMIERASKGDQQMRPNAIVYNTVLHIWSILGNPERAEALLQQMYDDFKNKGHAGAEPNSSSFTSVITAWSNFQKIDSVTSTSVSNSSNTRERNIHVGERGEAILRRMQELHASGELRDVKPNVLSFAAASQCWANTRSQEAGERAEALIREMEENSTEQWEKEFFPIAYGAVVQAYASSGDTKRAESFLARLHRQYREGNLGSKPTLHNLTILLSAWSRSPDPQAPARAEQLLQEMHKLYKEGIIDQKPNVVTYSTVLDCFAKSSLPGAAAKAEAILDEMVRKAKNGDESVRPNIISYRHVINAYARVGDVEKAEEVLGRMFNDYKHGNTRAKPNLKTLNLVLSALSNSNYPDAAQRALAFLKRMQDLYDKGLLDKKPDVVSYTIALKCVSNSGDRDAGEQAEKVIDRMEELAFQGDSGARPNTMTYSTAIQAYSKVGNAKGAEALLERMYKNFTEGNKEVKPNVRTFTNVLQAWARSGRGDTSDRLLAILGWMKELHATQVLDDVKPNAITYATVLGGLSRSKKDMRAQVVALLDEMEELALASNKEVEPNGICYNNSIHAFAARGDATGAQELVARMYQKYQAGNLALKPDISTWNILLNAWARSEDSNAPFRAEAILNRMYELYESGVLDERPNAISYSSVLSCWSRVRQPGALKREHVSALIDRMESLADSGDKLIFASMNDYAYTIRLLCRFNLDDITARAEVLLQRMLGEYDRSSSAWNPNESRICFESLIAALGQSRLEQ